MPGLSHKYLRPEDVRHMANYRFGAQMMVEGWLAGRHRAKGRGASSDFLEYRPYSPGDDLRLMDWRLFARTDKHYLKAFENETHLECHIFLDSSASMGFRQGAELSKLEYASFFAACLSWLIVKSNDLVSLQIFDDSIRHFLPAGSTHKHLNQLLHLLEANKPGGETSISAALDRSRSLLKRRGSLVIISDFLDDPALLFRALNSYLHRGFKLILLQVLDPAEIRLTDKGAMRYKDMETGEQLVLHPEQIRDEYHARMQAHRQSIRAFALSRGVHFFSVSTRDSYYTLFDELAR